MPYNTIITDYLTILDCFKCRSISPLNCFLKWPKHEIFEIEFFTQIRPVRIGDLGTGEKNLNIVRLSYDLKVFAAYILLGV